MFENLSIAQRGLLVAGCAVCTFLLSALGIWGGMGFLICLFIISIIIMVAGGVYAVHDK